MTEKERKNIRRELLRELDHITNFYNSLLYRGSKVIAYYDYEIERIIEKLKASGK
jgi:hypothetical protein